MLKVKDLVVNYGGIKAVKGISFEVPAKSIVTLIGSNGAGKSSSLQAILGLVKPKSGSILLEGEDIFGMKTEEIVAKGVTMTPEGRRIFPNLTVLENIKIGAFLRNDDLSDDIEWVYSLFPRLKERHWQMAGTLSGGEQQMLCVARALMSKPKLLMLDEPSMGLAPLLVEQIFDIIRQLHADGTTILLVEQNAQAALAVADRGYVLETGRVVTEGAGAELLESDTIRKAYLGG